SGLPTAPAEQMDLAIEHDCRHGAAGPAEAGNRRPLVGCGVVDKALGMRTAVLLDEAAERVNLRSDRATGHVVAGEREGRLNPPTSGFWIEHLVKILVDAMLCVAGDGVDLALAFDHRMLAGRDRHARLLDPFAGISGLGRDAGHVALFLDRFGNVGYRLVIQTEKERKFLFCYH